MKRVISGAVALAIGVTLTLAASALAQGTVTAFGRVVDGEGGHRAPLAHDLARARDTARLDDLVHVEVDDPPRVDAAVSQHPDGVGRRLLVAHAAG